VEAVKALNRLHHPSEAVCAELDVEMNYLKIAELEMPQLRYLKMQSLVLPRAWWDCYQCEGVDYSRPEAAADKSLAVADACRIACDLPLTVIL